MPKPESFFQEVLPGFSFLDSEHYPDSIYGLTLDFKLAYFNPAWFSFAAENGGEPQISREWGLGRSVFDAIPADLAPFYHHLYTKALATSTTAEHVYECSSPRLHRKYHQIIYPASGRGLLIVNALVVAMPIEQSPPEPVYSEQEYRDADGLLHQCAHCRKLQNLRHENRWDWIGYFVNYPPPQTSHTLCPQCRGYYYHLDGLPARK